jgi:hypothetical protein
VGILGLTYPAPIVLNSAQSELRLRRRLFTSCRRQEWSADSKILLLYHSCGEMQPRRRRLRPRRNRGGMADGLVHRRVTAKHHRWSRSSRRGNIRPGSAAVGELVGVTAADVPPPPTGVVTHQLAARHRAVELQEFRNLIDRTVLADLTIHVLLDNSSTHKTPAIQGGWSTTPASSSTSHHSSSWMNLVERWLAGITTKWIPRGTHRRIKQPATSITQWVGNRNDEPPPACGTRPPTRSSTASPFIVNKSRNQDTSSRR